MDCQLRITDTQLDAEPAAKRRKWEATHLCQVGQPSVGEEGAGVSESQYIRLMCIILKEYLS